MRPAVYDPYWQKDELCIEVDLALWTPDGRAAPMLAPAAGPVASVLVATMTGIASALLVYWIERLDVFGVRRKREHTKIMRELDLAIEEGDRRIDAIYDSVMNDPDWELLGPA